MIGISAYMLIDLKISEEHQICMSTCQMTAKVTFKTRMMDVPWDSNASIPILHMKDSITL